jgi:hypothetical protein
VQLSPQNTSIRHHFHLPLTPFTACPTPVRICPFAMSAPLLALALRILVSITCFHSRDP